MDHDNWPELVRRFCEGDSDAVRILWQHYGPLLHQVAARQMADRLKARISPEDVVQSACRTFLRRAKTGQLQLDDSESLWRLLFAITVTKVREQARYHLRQKRSFNREVPLASTEDSQMAGFPVADRGPAPDETVLFADEFTALLQSLNPEERAIVDLKLQDLTHEEIADRLKMSERTVRRLFARIRHRLNRTLGDSIG